MNASNYDVIVVGAGAAGLTAAIGLARAGFGVVVVEAAAFPGAENWSGCVYFCENLAHPDILGPEGVESLAWERRLIERGFFSCDGQSLLGFKYRDPQAFRHCYTVLRPIYDHHLAQIALRHGVAILNRTTAETLIREAGRIVGISTSRGPLYADLVFLAEGDASHLVTREGYERFTDQRETPKFLQGIKQVIDLPPGTIEKTFGVGPEEGVAYEMLLRNGSLRGRDVHLNMGGFIYTNRQSLSIGLVLPADNLRNDFGGDPNLLLEWFSDLPALQPWLQDGKRGVFGAKLIRGGGAKDVPFLVDDGLAIGGAASAIGIDFPYPNFTGPATAMGRLLAQAVVTISREGTGFTKEALRRHYLEPLQQTHYWKDVEFLRNWPGYIKRTQVFFGRNIDLTLGTAYVWSRPRRWFITKWMNWLRLMLQVAGPAHWRELLRDLRDFMKALRLREVVSQPQVGRLLLDGTINTLRDFSGSPRPDLQDAGTIRVHYVVAGDATPPDQLPAILRRWFRRLTPVLASAAGRVYRNDDVPLSAKLPEASQVMVRQLNILDLAAAMGLGLAAFITGTLVAGWSGFVGWLRGGRRHQPRGLYPRYAVTARAVGDMTPLVNGAAQRWDERLGSLAYETVKASHIHLLWPRELRKKDSIIVNGLWHVCPAHVYEARVTPQNQLQVLVNFENCIKCETCWRTSDLVDWGRDGAHRFIYPVASPVVMRLLGAMHAAGAIRAVQPRTLDRWEALAGEIEEKLKSERVEQVNGQDTGELAELGGLLTRLDGKLREYDAALTHEPRTIDRGRSEYLEMLARYAQQLAIRVVEVLNVSTLADSPYLVVSAVHRQLVDLAQAIVARCEDRGRRTWDQRFAWAAADGRQLRQHHLPGLQRLLGVVSKRLAGEVSAADPTFCWLRAEQAGEQVTAVSSQWRARLDAVFPATAWRDIDRGEALTSEQDGVLRDLLAQVPVVTPGDLAGSLHPPLRKALLAELGRRDPSLAYRVAGHLWARDVACLHPLSPAIAEAARRWATGQEWACFVAPNVMQTMQGAWIGEDMYQPAIGAKALLLLLGGRLMSVSMNSKGITTEPLATLGLRGAGLCRLRLDHFVIPENSVAADHNRVERVWQVLSAADLTSIAFGMADRLTQRSVEHATTRVQFPGLFQDEEARDPIGKFGAVKKMVAGIAARRYLLETLNHTLTPLDFSSLSVERAGLVKALAAEALGAGLDSVTYAAGQVFGGTGYSEDDILSKFYRDAAAWRFLGPANGEVYRQHGDHLLRTWQPDGRRLVSLPNEASLFDQLVQRKALQAELDEARVLRSRLRGLVNDWQDSHKHSNGTDRNAASAVAVAEMTEEIARQSATLLAAKALVLRTHARLEHGIDSELEVALLRVWLGDAATALEHFETAVHRACAPAKQEPQRPVVDPGRGPPITTYADYLVAAGPYDSGDFLLSAVDPLTPRFVPEIIDSDPSLAARAEDINAKLDRQFAPSRGQGLPYERYIELNHRPDPEDLDFLREHGFFRMTIPRELGGEGRPKVDYYLLTTGAQRRADVAISLTIQVSSSIGTTPIYLARDKDLLKAQKELAGFVDDRALQREIETRLIKLIDLAATAVLRRVDQSYRELQKRLEETVLGRVAVRTLAFRFVAEWQNAGQACKAFDPDLMRQHLDKALAHWRTACASAAEMHAEIGRRLEACALFLRWIASGQISAFALTEPSAGSDTARVATRARLRSVPVAVDDEGVYSFIPAGAEEARFLLDARRLEFRPDGAYYRWSDAADPARIHFEDFDYETDDPGCCRYYFHGPRRVDFTDIAQFRERQGRLWYDYWELDGSKMWITNGRMCGVMCLYAKTDEGITGFLVDRHAEGLVVGKDEAKMGQLGSPTNELSLQAVRVPRENVLGLEGRGQVNALETLNVGRAGLAMSGMAQMAGLIEFSRAFAHAAYGDIPDWIEWRLQRMEEERFSAEALAHEVVGRFEHPGTKSVRMESAIAKMQIGEMLHHVIELAEEIHGLVGQTQFHLIEKRKRDARIWNIYEGTNEIQRFFVLKDLVSELAPRWARVPTTKLPGYLGVEALELETLRIDLRRRLTSAVDSFGGELWQNPNLQADCFLLSEAAAWFKTAESALARLAWLERQALEDDGAEPSVKLAIGLRAFARCCLAVKLRLRRLDEELAHLRRGFYAPEIRAASLLFDRTEIAVKPPILPKEVTQPLSILVIVEPSAGSTLEPHVSAGRLLDAHFSLSDADRSALEAALCLRDSARATVTIEVIAAGPRGYAQVLREALNVGVDRVRLLVAETDAVTIDSAAVALAGVLRGSAFDLIFGAAGDPSAEEGLLARLIANGLDVVHVGQATDFVVRKTAEEATISMVDAQGKLSRPHPLPAALAVEAGQPLRSFTTQSYLAAQSRIVEIERWPRDGAARPVSFEASRQTATDSGDRPGPLEPSVAAHRVLEQVGLVDQSKDAENEYTEAIEDVWQPNLTSCGTLAVIAAAADGSVQSHAEPVLRAAQLLASRESSEVAVLLLAPSHEESQRRALASLPRWFRGRVLVLPVQQTELNGWLIQACWPELGIAPRSVVAEPWAEEALAQLFFKSPNSCAVFRIRRLSERDGEVIVETARSLGKLYAQQALPKEAPTCWLTLASEAEVAASPLRGAASLQVARWSPSLERFHAQDAMKRLLDDLWEETGIVRLSDADFIIDVGFGVGNRDGYEAVILPLERTLRELGIRKLAVGGSRKVTEELHLLPLDRQIGQSGVSVNPRVLLAIGISGAPQHLNYLGPRAFIVAFNRNPDAPLLTLNQRQPRPRVYPVIGDLFETVPAFTAALQKKAPLTAEHAESGRQA
jgi:alkylation response protein AidB-like acyl-CoA dehydrogenase/flavin-dependent dehydrogenase/electron transfer flavoprotein alpha subunit/electron transfer flavoprotein alpha/beta subunit/ferredoxin-like protein FixX